MSEINIIEEDKFWADSTIIEAANYVFVGYCMGNERKSIDEQTHGAIAVLESCLKMAGLTLDSIVKMDCSFKDITDLNYLAIVFKERFSGKYPT